MKIDEKVEVVESRYKITDVHEKTDEFDIVIDAVEDIEDPVEYQLTIRAIVIGSTLGCIMSASNLYLGFKTGLNFYACFFGSILGYGIGKLVEPLPHFLGGGKLGIRENCTIQAATTATGLITIAFHGPIPLIFRAKIIETIDEAWGAMFCWMLGASFFGMFFAVPMRSYFVIQQQLAFPGPSAAAHIIKSLHTGKGDIPKKQTLTLVYSLLSAIVYKITVYFLPVLSDLHIIYWIGYAASFKPFMDIDSVFRWYIQTSPAYVGIGMMSGLNAGVSMFAGCIVSWGILSPLLFFYSDEVYKLRLTGNIKGEVTVGNWNLWVGVVIILTATITDLLINYKSIFGSLRDPITYVYNNYVLKVLTFLSPMEAVVYDNKDPVNPDDQIPTWQWVSGIIVSVIITILTHHFYFGIHIGLTILACVMSFILSYVACQIYGETFINPGGSLAKGTQVVFSGIPAATPTLAYASNLLGGALTLVCSAQATEMVGDLKTGHILKASPKSQFYAQLIATIPGVFISVALFYVFAKAYPCIIDSSIVPGSENCPFALPNVISWEFITNALVSNGIALIPYSCKIAILISFLVTVIITILRGTFFKKHAKYFPNMAMFGLSFIYTGSIVPFGIMVGGIIAWAWERFHQKSYKIYFISLSSGLVAGEGLGGLITAVFSISGMNQEKYATAWGCIKSATSC